MFQAQAATAKFNAFVMVLRLIQINPTHAARYHSLYPQR
jgi:hypothetical protein